MPTTPPARSLIVVTGASTGMGAATARELARRGFHVLAGVRRDSDAEAIRAANIEPVILDITRPEQVAELARRVASDPAGRPLRALVNNAGVAANAPVEALPLADWRWVFEVNVFGQIGVTQALLPALLAGSGRVVNISAVLGKVSLPASGAYSGSKFALEAISDSLRRELAPEGVRVVVVQPGGVRTQMRRRGLAKAGELTTGMSADHQQRYGPLMRAVVKQIDAFTDAGVSAEKAALVIARAVTDRRPRTRYTVGRDAAALTRLARVLPDRLLDRVLAANFRPHFEKAG
ncbi:SDR family oxidoreductase [Streptomyces tauricus]